MNRIAISETALTKRIETSFSQEREFFLAGNEAESSAGKMFNRRSYKQNLNFSTPCHKNLDFFCSKRGLSFAGNEVEGSSGKNV